MSAQQQHEPVYALYAQAYVDAGWPCVLPVPPETKSPPPEGFTGADGRDTDIDVVTLWTNDHAYSSIALRMPDGVIGIDVDHYPKGQTLKVGGETLAALEAVLGPLPPTWISSARPAPSGIRFYRVPPGRYATKLISPDGSTGDIEVIQRHHRYAVVAPSHHEVGGAYAWYHGDLRLGAIGWEPVNHCPSPDQLPELPPAWVEHLRSGATVAGPAAAPRDDGDALLVACMSSEQPCVAMLDALTKAESQMAATNAGTRHDIAIERVHHVVHLAAAGHPGLARAYEAMTQLWNDLTAGEQRESEWERMWTTSARKAVTWLGSVVPRSHVVTQGFAGPDCQGDAAQLEALFGLTGVHNGYGEINQTGQTRSNADHESPEVQSPELDPDWLARYGLPAASVGGLLGTQPFDPPAMFDQDIAAAVLQRVWPALRFAEDARVWYRRNPDGTWGGSANAHRGMIDYLTDLAPAGDSHADDNTPAKSQAKRRARLKSNAGSGAVAGKMSSLVTIPGHPSVIQAGALDTEPELMWAGGLPWDLAASVEGPRLAEVGWAEPHRHDAGVRPEQADTPAWNAFCRAVWPDEKLRGWALRVLSIALTGYADAAMPVLLGDSGRGKSSVAHLLTKLIGSYGAPLNPTVLFGGTGGDKYLNQLHGLRLAFVDESPFESAGATERLKQITGGASINADVKYERQITFELTHTVVITSNHDISLSDPALIRRYRPIACDGDPEEVRRTRVALAQGDWERERAGVLAAMMTQAGLWLADRASAELAAMPELAVAVMQQAAEDDVIGRWLIECTTYDETGLPARQLYANFEAWCRGGRVVPERSIPSECRWGRDLTKRQLNVVKRVDANYRPLVLRGLRSVSAGHGLPGLETPETTVEAFWRQVSQPTLLNPPQLPKATTPTILDDDLSTELSNPQNPSSTPSTVDSMDTLDTSIKKKVGDIEEGTNRDDVGQGHDAVEESRETTVLPSYPSTHPGVDSPGEPAPHPANVAAICPAISGPIAFDLETHTADALYTTGSTFLRLGVLANAEGEPVAGLNDDGSARPALTNDWRGLVEQLHGAADDSVNAPEQPWSITGHNLFGFDYQALARYAGLDLARVAGATFDTLLAARYLDPPMARDKGVDATRKYDLDSVGEKLGLGGKQQGGLAPIAKRHPCDTAGHPGKTRAMPCAGAIPLDDEQYQGYARRDAVLQSDVAHALSPAMEHPYLRREHHVAAIAAQMSLNGLPVDTELLQRRLTEGADRKELALQRLHSQYGIPIIDGRGRRTASPLATNDGRAALERALMALAVPQAAIPRTTGGLIAVGGDGMRELAQAYPQAGEICGLVAAVTGERTIYQTVAKHLVDDPDGITRVHPKIGFDQATGRWSLTRPGMTVFGKRGDRWHEREVILPEPGHVIITIDLSQVDMRGIAALSQDQHYIAMFAPGRDAHTEIAGLLGLEREPAKAMGHGWNYGLGVNAMIRDGIPEHLARQFDAGMRGRFPRLCAWREEVREEAKSGRLLDNGWGRPMRPNPDRAYTQGPALKGQGAARDIGMEGLLRLPVELRKYLLAFVHDEIVLSVPAVYAHDIEAMVTKAMSFEWLGVPIVAQGQTWTIDGQTVPAHGQSWGHVYSKVG